MSYKNRHHLNLPTVRILFNDYLERYSNVADQSNSAHAAQLETVLGLAGMATFKIVHPLLIQQWRSPRVKYRQQPLNLIGLDIETEYTTGSPKLIGCHYPNSEKYYPLLNPDLRSFFRLVKSAMDNTGMNGFVVWGRLDIQCIIRLFQPTEPERKRISRGIGANVKNGKIIGSPPALRVVDGVQFYISHYISGRSLKLAYIEAGREWPVWIYNLSQFWQNTIAITAKGLGLEWQEFAKNTHLIDWSRFGNSAAYRDVCLASNAQDARVVCALSGILQQRFFDVFKCYPSLLVSTGSLTDAAVSKMLEDNPSDYFSNSWKWLATHVWKNTNPSVIALAESLLAEAFSAGYVDQFALGYFPELHVADIAAAYPHKIRALPDLRYSVLVDGTDNLENDLVWVRSLGYDIETVIIRGVVQIPDTLRWHPITVKTFDRENIRPVGKFHASYLLEERQFCSRHGATFSNEKYVIVALRKRIPAPIARVSEKLGEMRTELLAELRTVERNSDRFRLLDGLQYLVKVIDNSIYGKTVMTTEVVQDIDGQPVITGYIAGDRFNPLYGAIITSRTRVQLAEAAMHISANGGRPVMAMTDSLFWSGSSAAIDVSSVAVTKTPGFFESVKTVRNAFILKTGQYEYFDGTVWEYKLRGLPVDYDIISGKESLYRRLIVDFAAKNAGMYVHPKNVIIPLQTRRLISIGMKNLDQLGMISEGITEVRPFSLSGKQNERWVLHWPETLHGAIWLETATIKVDNPNGTDAYPLSFLSQIYEGHVESWSVEREADIQLINRKASRRMDDMKRLYIWLAQRETNLPSPSGRAFRLSWTQLETYFDVVRSDLKDFEKYAKEKILS